MSLVENSTIGDVIRKMRFPFKIDDIEDFVIHGMTRTGG